MMRSAFAVGSLIVVQLACGAALAQSGHLTDNLVEGDALTTNQRLISPNGRYIFVLQGDGNIVLRDLQTGNAEWSSKTNGQSGVRLKLQGDGNLVLRTSSGSPVWSSKTGGSSPARLVLFNNGAAALFGDGDVVWNVNGDPPPDDVPTSGHLTDNLVEGDTLTLNQRLVSPNGQFILVLQSDGNIVLRDVLSGDPKWSSKTNGQSADHLILQGDGNLVLYTAANTPLWASGTVGSGEHKLVLSDDGSAVLFRDAQAVWEVNTPPDTNPPAITLLGGNPVSVVQGSTFDDPGATALDDRDGDLTALITVSSDLDTQTVGTYTLSYNVSDAAGNAAVTAERTVNVIAANDGTGHLSDRLFVGETLTTGQWLVSPNHRYIFLLQGDGNLVLSDQQTLEVDWASDTEGLGGTRLKLQGDGNLVLRTDSGSSVWSSKTSGSSDAILTLADDGTLALFHGQEQVWSAQRDDSSDGGSGHLTDNLVEGDALTLGQKLISPNGRYIFVLQGDGNIVLRDLQTGGALWSSKTNGQSADHLVLQGDGNLVLYTAANVPLWASGTVGSGTHKLILFDDGSVALFRDNLVVWSVGGNSVPADTTPPVLTLVGASLITIEQGSTFVDPGATAFDDRDGDLTASIAVSGNVDTGALGSYVLSYNVSDSAGNAAATLQRTVDVILPDQDSDGIADPFDNCPTTPNGNQADLDGDGLGDACDGDLDGDGLANASDPCPTDPADLCAPEEEDTDGDGFTDDVDNCPAIVNGDQSDIDGDLLGDVCDPDIDGDGVPNENDVCPMDPEDKCPQGNGRFSTPNAALYSRNSSRKVVFPKVVDSTFNGNGHTETWDGRVMVRTITDGWAVSAIRPERIAVDGDGAPVFNQVFSNTSSSSRVFLERRDGSPHQINWIAIVPDPEVTTENPFPSNSSGAFRANGAYLTYKALVIHTTLQFGTNKHMGQRRATIVVMDPYTPSASIQLAQFTSNFEKYTFDDGDDFLCIEPSVSIDGRLIICQGHPSNDGRIDNLVYSWNDTAGDTSNWKRSKSIANMYFDDRSNMVDGIEFKVRYPIAEQPIKDAAGDVYNRGALVKGAYPWVSHDGSELFYQASREGVSARRTGTSVVGRWTGWTIRHIDGPINRSRYGRTRLFMSSPGAFTTMWSPYKDLVDLPIPYSIRGPGYPIFGSNSRDYSEVGFDDYLDGDYVMYLGMNEQLSRSGSFLVTQSPDTSGHFNNATLNNGAEFPYEFNGQDVLIGRNGQGIYFPENSYLSIDKRSGWDTLGDGFTVDFFVRVLTPGRQLFTIQNTLDLTIDGQGRLSARLIDQSGAQFGLTGSSVSTSQWVHVAFSFDPESGEMILYLNGQQVAQRIAGGIGDLDFSGWVRVGPTNSPGFFILDEVKVSNVVRQPFEIAHNAKVSTHVAPSAELTALVPPHLEPALSNATGVDRFSLEAALLGEELFSDVILSKQRTTSCATCHNPALEFTDGLAIARGNEPTDAGERNTPTLHNRLFSSFQGWGGIAESLDRQALIPIAAPHEMNLPIDEAVARLAADSHYSTRFQSVYGEPPDANNLPSALASFQAVLFSPRSRVDDYLDGDKSALTDSERRGLDLFRGKARCSGCHAGRNFTDESFRSNGLIDNGDIGRARQTGRDRDYKLFKVPTLRLIDNTAPYMHDGSIPTLRAVIQAYNAGAPGVVGVDTDIRPLELSPQEIDDLVSFLQAL